MFQSLGTLDGSAESVFKNLALDDDEDWEEKAWADENDEEEDEDWSEDDDWDDDWDDDGGDGEGDDEEDDDWEEWDD
ncbi:MAG: hypothetical protein HKN71_03590 [Gemmatimonadetes bacterium]|nr:hypothetical protein [Gemmatimonadota bacterium]